MALILAAPVYPTPPAGSAPMPVYVTGVDTDTYGGLGLGLILVVFLLTALVFTQLGLRVRRA